MALLAAQQIKITGLNPSFAPAAASDTVEVKDDRVIVVYRNTDAAPRTVSLVTPAKLDKFGQPLGNVEKTLAALTGQAELGPITQDFVDPATGLATVTVSATANVTVAAFRI